MKTGISVLSLAIALSTISGIAAAQDASNQDEQETRKLATVTVTAQKREESLQDVPISMMIFRLMTSRT